MTDYPYEGEVQLLGFAWNPDDGNWARFRFHSDTEEGGHPFKGLPRGRENGQRFRIRFDLIADDETTTAEPAPAAVKGGRAKRHWWDMSMPEQAGILVNDPDSAQFIALYLGVERKPDELPFFPEVASDADWCREADRALKRACQIESKSELGVDNEGIAFNPTARAQFMTIERELRARQRGQGEQQADQRRDGYGG